MLKVTGRYITFNNMHFDEYLSKVNNYVNVCELITKFREDKITPTDIKRTQEYKQGSYHQDPFYQFYKVIDQEIINKFEKDILTTENILSSIEYTTITEKQLQRWYKINLEQYKRGNVNESFVIFNNLLMEDYIELKREGVLDKDIQRQLNVKHEMYEFFISINKEFESQIIQIKKDLLLKALNDDKTRDEAIKIAGVTPKEYDDIVKFSNFKEDEFSKKRNLEVESRKERLVEFLKTNDLKSSCNLAKITVDDFYEWYGEDVTSEFYLNSTTVLMHNFLNERRKGKSKVEAAELLVLTINMLGIGLIEL